LDLPKAEKVVEESKERVEKEKADKEKEEKEKEKEKEKEEKETEAEASTSTSTSTSTSSSSSAAPAKPVVNIFDVEEVMRLQEQWLVAQIELAIELDKPLFFHERGATLIPPHHINHSLVARWGAAVAHSSIVVERRVPQALLGHCLEVRRPHQGQGRRQLLHRLGRGTTTT
jgi:hypothetical protein